MPKLTHFSFILDPEYIIALWLGKLVHVFCTHFNSWRLLNDFYSEDNNDGQMDAPLCRKLYPSLGCGDNT
jgi:hypothetical protein